jgi:Fe-S cluster biogenesis protein NfuA
MRNKIENVLNEIRPFIYQHGGEVELIGVKNNVVTVKMSGACSGCALSAVTLKDGIETIIMEEFPEITEVVSVDA